LIHLVLYEPEIPPNTGNIIRLAANTGFDLHLIKPLGFKLDDRRLKRAGLDYHEKARLATYESLDQFLGLQPGIGSVYAVTTKGTMLYSDVAYKPGDVLLFGPETRGLPDSILGTYPTIKIPMHRTGRSLNLSNAVAIVAYEAWRQLQFQNRS
jgi:tRNA (cytidine/uridine-2'-O-)-methyltransferase